MDIIKRVKEMDIIKRSNGGRKVIDIFDGVVC